MEAKGVVAGRGNFVARERKSLSQGAKPMPRPAA
jgi:hypothetical protein